MNSNYYFLKHDDIVTGPFTHAALLAMRNANRIAPDCLVSSDKVQWTTAEKIHWLFQPAVAASSAATGKLAGTAATAPSGDSQANCPSVNLVGHTLAMLWNTADHALKLHQCKGKAAAWTAYSTSVVFSLILLPATAYFAARWINPSLNPWLFVAMGATVALFISLLNWMECTVCHMACGQPGAQGTFRNDLVMAAALIQNTTAAYALVLVLETCTREFQDLPVFRCLEYAVFCFFFINAANAVRAGLSRFAAVKPCLAIWLSTLLVAINFAPFCLLT